MIYGVGGTAVQIGMLPETSSSMSERLSRMNLRMPSVDLRACDSLAGYRCGFSIFSVLFVSASSAFSFQCLRKRPFMVLAYRSRTDSSW